MLFYPAVTLNDPVILGWKQVSTSENVLRTGIPPALTFMLPGNAALAAQCIGTKGHGGCGVTKLINFARGLPFAVTLVTGIIATPPATLISPTLTTICAIIVFINGNNMLS